MKLSKQQVRDLWYNLVWELDIINDKTRDDYFDIKDLQKILYKSLIDYEGREA